MAKKIKKIKPSDINDMFGGDFNDENYLLDEYEEDFDYMSLIGKNKKNRGYYNENEY